MGFHIWWFSLALNLSVIECIDLNLDKSVKNSVVNSQIFIQSNIFLIVQVSLFVIFLFSFSWIYHKLNGRVNSVIKDLEKIKRFLKDCIAASEAEKNVMEI